MSDRLARIERIVSGWASDDSDGIDDLDALCQIAEVLGIEVEARETPASVEAPRRPYCIHCHDKGFIDGPEKACAWCNPGGEFRSLRLGTPDSVEAPVGTGMEHCPQCGYSATNDFMIQQHVRDVHPEPQQSQCVCVESIKCAHCLSDVRVIESAGKASLVSHFSRPGVRCDGSDKKVRGNWRDDPSYKCIFSESK